MLTSFNILSLVLLSLLLWINPAFSCFEKHKADSQIIPVATKETVKKFNYINALCDFGVSSSSGSIQESQQMKLYSKPSSSRGSIPVLPNSGLPSDMLALAEPFMHSINNAATLFNIDPLLLHAMAYVESAYNPEAISPAGAKGLMQVMPATARDLGFTGDDAELLDPEVSLKLGALYLRRLYDRFGNDLPLILAGYNAGENAIVKHGLRIPPYPETERYVKKVMERYQGTM